MADLKRKYHRISKGDKVPVLIEDALEDVLIVTLKSGTKEFRGILLDCNRRNIPHGVCYSSLPHDRGKSGEQGVNSTSNGLGENENEQTSVSASAQRYTYNNDPLKLTEKVTLIQSKGDIRPVRSKSVRDIRLRPRQTLCSKCKNMIHDSGKGSSSKASSPKVSKPPQNLTKPQLSPSRHLNRPVVTLKWGLRKRKYQQEPEPVTKGKVKKPTPVKSANVKTRSERQTRSSVDSKIAQARETFPEVRLYKLEDVKNEVKVGKSDNENSDNKIHMEEEPEEPGILSDEVDSATEKTLQSESAPKTQNAKATPVIKISIGDGAVLKIPPRLPGAEVVEHPESGSEDVQEKFNDPPIENTNYLINKKLKKAMKKSKDRVRNKSGDHEIRAQGMDEKSDKIHHRKHKRKHKHKHLSPYESRPLESSANVIINEWNASEEKDSFDKESVGKDSTESEDKPLSDWVDQITHEENEDEENSAPVEEESRNPRPRLLYTWNNNRGLSRVEASPKASPKIRSSVEERSSSEDSVQSLEKVPLEEKFQSQSVSSEEKFSSYSLDQEILPYDIPVEDKFQNFSSEKKYQSVSSPLTEKFGSENFSFDMDYSETFRADERTSSERCSLEEKFHSENFPLDDFQSEDYSASDKLLMDSVPDQVYPTNELPVEESYPAKRIFPHEQPPLPYEAAPPPMIVGMGPYSPISSASEPSEDPVDLQLRDTMGFEEPHLGGMVGEADSMSQQVEQTVKNVKPLMMKIHTCTVPKCVTDTGRQFHVGDIVWGKIQGFPWWPGRIISITVTQKDNGVVLAQLAHVTWFGSSTMSHMQCSELFPFLEDFKLRFNKKKRGPYRVAIKQATIAAQASYGGSDEHFDFADLDDYKSS